VKPEPQGVESFSRSRSCYNVSAPAPGQTRQLRALNFNCPQRERNTVYQTGYITKKELKVKSNNLGNETGTFSKTHLIFFSLQKKLS
jgi:hypothetical protein